MIRHCIALLALLVSADLAHAEGRQKLGYGLMITNDTFGDTQDRWRTGSFESSLVFGHKWDGQPPSAFGSLLEIRFNGQIISPENAALPDPLDRPYAQAVSLGLHTHFQPAAIEYAVGVDVVVTGSQLGLDDVQDAIHSVTGGTNASDAVLDAQIGNNVHAGVVLEAGRSFQMGRKTRLRPFVELRGGVETLARAGFDLTFGGFGRDGLLVRTPVAGHRLSVVEDSPYRGLSVLVGADFTYVEDSIFLESSGPVRLNDTRARARAGLHWRSQAGTSLFYGVAWLDEEFNTQRESQFVGSLQLRLKF